MPCEWEWPSSCECECEWPLLSEWVCDCDEVSTVPFRAAGVGLFEPLAAERLCMCDTNAARATIVGTGVDKRVVNRGSLETALLWL
jgi:hypothetical protein